MGLFSFTQEIAIDLGTANTIIMCDDKIVVDEPSVVAISMADNKMVAVGRKAQQMIGKGGSMIRTVRPLRDQDDSQADPSVHSLHPYGGMYSFGFYRSGDPCGARQFGACRRP